MNSRILPTFVLALLAPLAPLAAWSQTTPTVGIRENPAGVHALVNARVVTAPGNAIARATVLVRDGLIEAVGADVRVPADARVWDLTGRTVYAGFIDPYSGIGMPTALATTPAQGNQEEDTDPRGAFYWSPQVRTFTDAASEFSTADEATAAALRSQGFTVALAVPQLGLFRGRSAVVTLGNGTAAQRVIRQNVAQSVMQRRDGRVGGSYPTSSMGAIAFIRQTFLDADWYDRAHAAYRQNPTGLSRPETNEALAALVPAVRGQIPVVFDSRNEEEALRALKLRDEFNLNIWIRGSGTEYKLLDEFRNLNVPLLLPVDFPNPPNVASPEAALDASLESLRDWYLAPQNPARLAEIGVRFAFTSDGLGNRASFLPNVALAVERGLSEDMALAALTTAPAEFLGISQTHGTIAAGKVANLVVVNGNLFAPNPSVDAVWVDGQQFQVAAPVVADLGGRWRVDANASRNLDGTLTLTGTGARLSGTFAVGGDEIRLGSAQVTGEMAQLQISLPGDELGVQGTVRMSASARGDAMNGWGTLPDGSSFTFTAERVGAANGANASGDGEFDARATALDLPARRPSMSYGRAGIPEQQNVLVRRATVWTMGPQGRMENADLLVTGGKVAAVGQNLTAPAGAVVIDGTGKHVTPGLIDAHLHAGASGGINETGSAIVPEVRIGDVLTLDNISMYRQLAGGLTSAHVMHGSANPIGGQNQHVKLRWGAAPEDLRIQGAPTTVKFALGENPKRREERYPDTRMGTEQIIRDHFLAAREYETRWKAWEANRRGIPPRRDLRLEALVGILNGDIWVQSHSYRQDEILMLMRMAEEFGFRIRAFHHGVEAYKVAPELAAHGAAAVVWSDWSSFKIEAYDATTYNARILMDAGVLTSLHSDDSQVASRMNWEAAKSLRNGLTEEQALALVTINTAKVVGIDSMVGSLEAGKDGDFVIWSGNPLSTATHAEQTWIEGRRYFDIEEDARMRQQVASERAMLIQLILNDR